jgi:hypothetical protein
MLIHKGNFPKIKSWFACLAMLLACCVGGQAQAAAQATPRGPEAVATEFYGWYLDTLSADQDPLSDRYDTFTRYVSKDLAAQLVKRLVSGRLPDTDYFIQSSGYRQAWQRSVRAALVKQTGGSAEVVVTLGKDGGAMRVLGLVMVQENGSWKIRHVTLVGSDFLKSSADQSVI